MACAIAIAHLRDYALLHILGRRLSYRSRELIKKRVTTSGQRGLGDWRMPALVCLAFMASLVPAWPVQEGYEGVQVMKETRDLYLSVE